MLNTFHYHFITILINEQTMSLCKYNGQQFPSVLFQKFTGPCLSSIVLNCGQHIYTLL